ncbi:rRNA-processing protein FCF1 [Microbotryum lychnidis-dioicae p1A1 Lamole]|uniref:rRNA-processing protein FCF1 n=1 Tax=Microbotryum lychnidis-dioicae (strain p1A1 Lamole / MvSl-1064) TaxID=683840 RepID=U5GZD3_USTV1|nr:rRNA-processing protein FCF1 [Microbotryum lychnidis-dioicae p1A1 Lamole]|eukprot:KDE09215.1 rRNA-processing protein FCF1 [Microbotryum lychnidis-dioicae p1A1 Lamole]
MGNSGAKKVRKFGAVKRMIAPTDMRLKANQEKAVKDQEKKKEKEVNHVAPLPTSLFLSHNEALVPPYRVLVDTNFINLSLENRIDLVKAMMDTLYAKAIPCISDCVLAELEKLGQQYRLALRVARDPRFERLPCSHKGTYADDCIVNRVTSHRCYIVATCDRALRRRIRKIPGVPLMYIAKKRYAIERLPDQALG